MRARLALGVWGRILVERRVVARDDIDALLVDFGEAALDLADELGHGLHRDAFAEGEDGLLEGIGRAVGGAEGGVHRRSVDVNPFEGGPDVVGLFVGRRGADEGVADAVEECVAATAQRAQGNACNLGRGAEKVFGSVAHLR